MYIPDQQMNMEAEKAQNPYHRNHFVYNEKDDCFICPENKVLPFYSISIHKRMKQQSIDSISFRIHKKLKMVNREE